MKENLTVPPTILQEERELVEPLPNGGTRRYFKGATNSLGEAITDTVALPVNKFPYAVSATAFQNFDGVYSPHKLGDAVFLVKDLRVGIDESSVTGTFSGSFQATIQGYRKSSNSSVRYDENPIYDSGISVIVYIDYWLY